MQALLGFFLFSVFLTTATSLECESCFGVSMNCTGKKLACEAGHDACATILTEVTQGGVTSKSVMKGCVPKSYCTAELPNIQIPDGTTTTKIECHNNASPAAASFLLVLSGILLMRILL